MIAAGGGKKTEPACRNATHAKLWVVTFRYAESANPRPNGPGLAVSHAASASRPLMMRPSLPAVTDTGSLS